GEALSVLCVFFFSSRRRHTRLVSDWSSDVCSSDLVNGSSGSRSRCSCCGPATSTGRRPRECGRRSRRHACSISRITGRTYSSPTDRKSVVEGKRGELGGSGELER